MSWYFCPQSYANRSVSKFIAYLKKYFWFVTIKLIRNPGIFLNKYVIISWQKLYGWKNCHFLHSGHCLKSYYHHLVRISVIAIVNCLHCIFYQKSYILQTLESFLYASFIQIMLYILVPAFIFFHVTFHVFMSFFMFSLSLEDFSSS